MAYNESSGIAVADMPKFKGARCPLFLFLVLAYLTAKVDRIHLEVTEDGLPTLLGLRRAAVGATVSAHRAKSRRTLESPDHTLLVLLPAMLKPLGPPATDRDQLVDLIDHVLRDFPALDGIEEGTAAKV